MARFFSLDFECCAVSKTAAAEVETSKTVSELCCVLASMLLDALRGECCHADSVEDLSGASVQTGLHLRSTILLGAGSESPGKREEAARPGEAGSGFGVVTVSRS